MTAFTRMALALFLSLALAAGQALAAAGGGGGGGTSAKKDNPAYAQAVKLVDAGDYAGAIPLLQKALAADPTNANAHNYLGFSQRKLGNVDVALIQYRMALELNPKHRGANEYLGELYLDLGQLDKAKERLAVLDDACFFGCDEYREFKEKIEAYLGKASR